MSTTVILGRFEEDGSFIGQYGTLRRQQMEQAFQQQQQQLQQQQPFQRIPPGNGVGSNAGTFV